MPRQSSNSNKMSYKNNQTNNKFAALEDSDGSGSPSSTPVAAPAPAPASEPTTKPSEKLPSLQSSKKIKVLTNSYQMNITPTDVYRFDVKILKWTPGKDAPFELTGSEGGSRQRQADCMTLLHLALKISGLEDSKMIYDGAATLYSTKQLKMLQVTIEASQVPEDIKASQFSRGPSGSFEVSIEPNTKQPMLNSKDLLQENAYSTSCPVTQMMQIALSEEAKKKGFLITDGGSEMFDTKNVTKLGGIEELNGIGAGIRIAEGKGSARANLVLDYKRKQFFTAGPLADLNLNWRNLPQVKSYLKGLRVGTTYSTQTFIISSVSNEPIGNIVLPNGSSLLQNAAKLAGKHVGHFDRSLPAIQAKLYSRELKKKIVYSWPVENLRLVANQKLTQKHGEPPRCSNPNQRFESTRTVGEAAMLLAPNETLKALGVTINPIPITVDAVSVQAPTIVYKGGATTKPDLGKKASWNVLSSARNSFGGFIEPTTIKQILILYNSHADSQRSYRSTEDIVSQLGEQLLSSCRGVGVTIENIRMEDLADTYPDYEVDEAIVKRMESLKSSNPKPIVIYADHSSQPTHAILKLEERLNEVIVQQASTDKSLKKLGKSTLNNILMKLNLKNGGLNHKVSMPDPSISHLWGDSSNTLIISYDVCHSSGGRLYTKREYCDEPSCVGFGYNSTKSPELIIGDFHYQLPRQEQVEQDILSTRAKLILGQYYANRKKCPDQIVILRDGVSEGQYRMVMEQEFPAIRQGIQEQLKILKVQKKPAFAYLVVTKRHANRLYIDTGNGVQNVPPLTAIDNQIVRKIGNEVIFVSHCPIAGTAQPVMLNLLHNEKVFKSNDQLVSFITALCSTHQKSTTIVSIPETVYAADEYAKRGSDLFQSYKFKLLEDRQELPKTLVDDHEQPDYTKITQNLCYHTSQFFKTKRIA